MFRITCVSLSALVLAAKLSAQITPVAPGSLCWNSATTDGSSNFAFTEYRTLDLHVDGYGNSYTAGYEMTQTTGSGERTYAFVISKFDENGVLMWQKNHRWPSIYSTNDHFLSAIVTGITVDNNKNVYISGYFNSRKLILDSIQYTYTTNTNRGFIAKLDSNGVCKWVSRLEGSGNYHSATSVIFSGDRLYVSQWGGGTLYMPDGSLAYPNLYSSIMEIGTNGILISDIPYSSQSNDISGKTFQADASTGYIHSSIMVNPRLQQCGNGDIYIVGRTEGSLTFGTITPTSNANLANGTYRTFCARLNSAHTWVSASILVSTDKDYSGNWLEEIEKKVVFTVDDSGNVYYADHWEALFMPGEHGNVCLSNGDTLDGESTNAACILKFDPNGNLLWQSIHSDVTFSGLASCSDGAYAFGTFADTLEINSLNGDSLVVLNSGSVEPALFTKCDVNGNFVWCSIFGGGATELAYNICKSPCSDNVYFTGLLSSATVVYNATDTIAVSQPNKVYLCKHSTGDPCVDPVCVTPDGIDSPDPGGRNAVSAFPCPTNSTLAFSNLPEGEYQLNLFDASGRSVLVQQFVQSADAEVGVSNLKAGMYFYSISGNGRYLVTGKFIKE